MTLPEVSLTAKTTLPTQWGSFKLLGFELQLPCVGSREHLALLYGNISEGDAPLTRIHSECLTGDALFSERCDCGSQLKEAFSRISAAGSGIILYHRQEGRGIGLLNKLKAYALQDTGMDTVQANEKLGFPADARDFSVCASMLQYLQIKKLRLLTNNPAKQAALSHWGITVEECITMPVKKTVHNCRYLLTKVEKLGHQFSMDAIV